MTDDSVKPRPSLPVGIIKAVRPKQWAKNVLVFVAPGAHGDLDNGVPLLWALFAFAVFSMAAGGTYLLNDILDVESDRKHPKKRHRPIAAGVVPIPLAIGLAIVLIVGSVGLAAMRTWQFGLVVALYVILTTLYSFVLKHQPVLDLVGLASGFILRLLGGAYAVQAPLTNWFLIISCFGALFIATSKRQVEKKELGDRSGELRATLAVYTDSYLNFLKAVSAGVVLVAYCQFALQRADEFPKVAVWTMLTIVPFIIAILRYALLVEQGKGSAPEEVILGDRQLQIIGLVWVGFMGLSVYGR